jgi:ABC-type Fe3+-siderophore transport system permease subunit
VTRAFLLFCLVLVVVSVAFSGTARAERNSQQDFCLRQSSACIEGCDQYSVTIWGVTWPSMKTALCVTECGIAYAGCLLMRFREGV